MLERTGDVQDQQQHQEPEQVFVDAVPQAARILVGGGKRGQVEHLEILQRLAGDGIEPPATQRQQRDQRVKRRMHTMRHIVLQARGGLISRRAIGQAPQHAQQEQRQHGQADRLVQGEPIDFLHGAIGEIHAKAEDAVAQDQQRNGPVKEFGDRSPLMVGVAKTHGDSLLWAWSSWMASSSSHTLTPWPMELGVAVMP